MPGFPKWVVAAVLFASGAAAPALARAEDQSFWQSAWHTLRDPGPETWYQGIWKNWTDTYQEGRWTAMLPINTYHLRFAYTDEKIDTYTEWPLGFGIARSRFDEYGNRREVFAFVFQDSHGKPQYQVGYLWLKQWRPLADAQDFRLGLGYTLFLMAREDSNYIPFPGILPVASVGYKRLTIETTYVPGGIGYGNVIFTWAQFTF
ncbi:MAG: lipid IV(A) palmitoyltransferase PagP [Burkholderiales bacterium]|nr:lipid IV(A) palmitoyltransferase PagP [Burkholderiales bacterium]